MGWEAVAKDRFLYQRGDRYYVRRRVPKALVGQLRKEHIVKSLFTSDYREASRLALLEAASIQRLFDDQRSSIEATFSTSTSEYRQLDDLPGRVIREIVFSWFRHETRTVPERFSRFTIPQMWASDRHESDDSLEDNAPEASINDLKVRLGVLTSGSEAAVNAELAPVISRICHNEHLACRHPKSGGIELQARSEVVADRQGSKFRIFRDLVLRGQIELLKMEITQLTGQVHAITDRDFAASLKPPYRPNRGATTLDELVQEFRSDPNRRSMARTLQFNYGFLVRVLDEVIGLDRRLADITRDDCKAVRDLLMRLPANATKKYPGLKLTAIADKAQIDSLPAMNPVTINSHLHKMSALFNYAVKEERMDRNPGRGLGLEGHTHTQEDRRPFSIGQLRRIFSAPLFTGCQDDDRRWSRPGPSQPRGTRFWIPIIALFHGLRLNEICQLRVADIERIEGVPVFSIRPGSSQQRVKSEAGRRNVPFHPFLNDLNFDEYVKSKREAGEDRLFPDLKQDTRGYYSDGFQKWFARFLSECDASGDRTSFHSFRHNWRDAMREAKVPQE